MSASIDRVPQGHRIFPSIRFLNFFLVFVGNVCSNVGFGTMNFALVCMVNSTADSSSNEPNEPTRTSCGSANTDSSKDTGYSGDIIWDRNAQANILAGYSWGLLFLTIPAGIVIDRFGVKVVFLTGQFLNLMTLFLSPTLAYMGEWWIFALRVICGIAGGFCWPSMIAMSSKWCPTREFGTLVSMGASGFPLGSLLANLVASLFCSVGYRGWTWAFYFWGILNVLLFVVYAVFYQNLPQDNKFITEAELNYIIANQPDRKKGKGNKNVPWRRLLCSTAVFAIITSNIGSSWTFYFVADFIPTYVKEVLNFDTTANGLSTAAPYLSQYAGRLFFGFISDRISCLSAGVRVKVFDAIGMAVPGLLFIVISVLDCTLGVLSIVCFCLGQFFYAASISGFLRSTFSIAPDYVGVIAGIGETSAAVASIAVPYVVGYITPHGTQNEWKTAMYITTALSAICVLNFTIFGRGNVVKWAEPESDRIPIECESQIVVKF